MKDCMLMVFMEKIIICSIRTLTFVCGHHDIPAVQTIKTF